MHPKLSDEAPICFQCLPPRNDTEFCQRQSCRGSNLPPKRSRLRSLASHVAVALECALARDTAELYHREVVKQRNQLGLLLEINNHIVSKLEAQELFQAVAASMRKHLGTDLTSLWLLNKQT